MSIIKLFQTNPGKYKRSVSIIGVGCTPMRIMLDTPELKGITEPELFAWGALEAMKDAGIEGKDIDAYIHGQVMSMTHAKAMCANVFDADWIGMRGKPSWHVESACATSYIAFDSAVMAVASGRYNVVLAGGVEMGMSTIGNAPNCFRRPITAAEHMEHYMKWRDPTYTKYNAEGGRGMIDDWVDEYIRQYGVTPEQLDEAFIVAAISQRRNAARCPFAFHRKEYKDIAKEAGYDDVMKYMKSPANPKVTQYQRLSGMLTLAEGAASVIVCPTEMAKNFRQRPIEVLGIGFSALDHRHPHCVARLSEEAFRQVYQVTGVKPSEIDILSASDFVTGELLDSAEAAGYLPRGEGWKYLLEGRTAFDGDKPINTEGGTNSFGHAYGVAGLAHIGEVVDQMRGRCGSRQVKKLPKTAMVRGQGGAQHVLAIILRTVR